MQPTSIFSNDIPSADGVLVGITPNGGTLSKPTTLAYIGGQWRLYVYPFNIDQPLSPENAHTALGDSVPYTDPDRDG